MRGRRRGGGRGGEGRGRRNDDVSIGGDRRKGGESVRTRGMMRREGGGPSAIADARERKIINLFFRLP